MPPVYPYRSSHEPSPSSVAHDLFTLANRFRDAVRTDVEDVNTSVDFVENVRRFADFLRRNWQLNRVALARRIDRELAELRESQARIERNIVRASGPGVVPTRGASFDVTVARPTVDQRYEIEVQGGVMDRRAGLVFAQNGRERRGRVTELGGTHLRGDIPLRELDSPGPWAVVLEQGGRRDELTTVEVG